MKTTEELNALKKEAESLNQRLSELTEEELTEVTGGSTSLKLIVALPIIAAVRTSLEIHPEYQK